MHQIYSSSSGVKQAYEESGAIYKKVRWKKLDSKEIKKYGKSPTFLEIAQRYYNLKYDFNNARAEIEKQYPFINEAFNLLGFQEISRLRTQKAVKEALLQAKIAKRPNHSELFKLLSEEIELGRFYQTCELKEICERHGLKQIKELKEWYVIESDTQRIDKKPRSGYWIIAIKAIQE